MSNPDRNKSNRKQQTSREQTSQVFKTCEVSTSLQPGLYYHIFNRGNNREDLFHEERNYRYFLQLYAQHVEPIADTFAYCLLRNHFHFLVRIKTEYEFLQYLKTLPTTTPPGVSSQAAPPAIKPSQHFSNLFNAYAKAINKAYRRTGSLFEDRFHRIVTLSDAHFLNLIFYIHFNPQKHGFVDNFRDWPWSSYHALATTLPTHLKRDEVTGWFGSVKQYTEFHQQKVDEKTIAALIVDDL